MASLRVGVNKTSNILLPDLIQLLHHAPIFVACSCKRRVLAFGLQCDDTQVIDENSGVKKPRLVKRVSKRWVGGHLSVSAFNY